MHLTNAPCPACADLFGAVRRPGRELSAPALIAFLADRLVEVHGDDPNVDFILAARDAAASLADAARIPWADRANVVRDAIRRTEGHAFEGKGTYEDVRGVPGTAEDRSLVVKLVVSEKQFREWIVEQIERLLLNRKEF